MKYFRTFCSFFLIFFFDFFYHFLAIFFCVLYHFFLIFFGRQAPRRRSPFFASGRGPGRSDMKRNLFGPAAAKVLKEMGRAATALRSGALSERAAGRTAQRSRWPSGFLAGISKMYMNAPLTSLRY